MLSGIRKSKFLKASEMKMYSANSAPIGPNTKSAGLERLLKVLAKTYDSLNNWLERNPDGLQAETPQNVQPRKGDTLSEHFAELLWHESNHVGELHALRELALVCLGKGWK
jgi:hypothetical protein